MGEPNDYERLRAAGRQLRVDLTYDNDFAQTEHNGESWLCSVGEEDFELEFVAGGVDPLAAATECLRLVYASLIETRAATPQFNLEPRSRVKEVNDRTRADRVAGGLSQWLDDEMDKPAGWYDAAGDGR